uniref:Uncharacterized protein n=1 Tax=Ascaris lumbricoides TaxID=6252 RepID=A0A0M3ITI9_ASCLU
MRDQGQCSRSLVSHSGGIHSHVDLAPSIPILHFYIHNLNDTKSSNNNISGNEIKKRG